MIVFMISSFCGELFQDILTFTFTALVNYIAMFLSFTN